MVQYSLSHKLTIPDALIAATALTHNISLYTLNLKDFRFIQGLNIYNPTHSPWPKPKPNSNKNWSSVSRGFQPTFNQKPRSKTAIC